jgi:hypothetical protein
MNILSEFKFVPLLLALSGVIGCSSLRAPTEPIDLKGNVSFAPGVIVHMDISSKDEMSRIMSASGLGKTMDQAIVGEMEAEYKAKIQIITVNDDEEVTAYKISDVSGHQVITVKKPVREKAVNKHPLAFQTISAEKAENGWSYTLKSGDSLSKDQRIELMKLESYLFQGRDMFPAEKVSANYKWTLKEDEFFNFYRSFGVASKDDKAKEMIEVANPKAELIFKGLREVDGKDCAVIDFTINGQGELSEEGLVMPFVLFGKGQIVRSLKSYRNVRSKHSFGVSGNANAVKEGIHFKASMKFIASGSCNKSFLSSSSHASQ